MTELIRPALYQAYHKIENLTLPASLPINVMMWWGLFVKAAIVLAKQLSCHLPNGGDLIAIRSAGAYGEVMSNRYNLRDAVQSILVNLKYGKSPDTGS